MSIWSKFKIHIIVLWNVHEIQVHFTQIYLAKGVIQLRIRLFFHFVNNLPYFPTHHAQLLPAYFIFVIIV